MKPHRQLNLHLALTIFLGIGMVLFSVLAVLAYRENIFTQSNLSRLNTEAGNEAAAKQKQIDDAANIKANQEPYRTYTAEPVNGGFQLQIPKNWSLYAGNNTSPQIQLNLAANPHVVVVNGEQSGNNAYGFHLQLRKASATSINKGFGASLKKKILTSKGVTVSGIAGTRYEGVIDQQRHNGVVVVLPVRDKTLVISVENPQYLNEFEKILSTAKIIP